MSWLEDIGDQQLIENWLKCSDWGTTRVKRVRVRVKDDMLQQNQLCGYTIHQFVAENLKKKNYRQIFLISRRIGKDVTFGASAQTMKRLKYKFKFSHEFQNSSGDTRTTLSHSPQSSFNQLTVQHVLDCGGKLKRPPITCKLQKDRAKPKLCFREAAVLPLHHRAALHSNSARLFFFFSVSAPCDQPGVATAPIVTTRSCWLPTYNHSSLHFLERR